MKLTDLNEQAKDIRRQQSAQVEHIMVQVKGFEGEGASKAIVGVRFGTEDEVRIRLNQDDTKRQRGKERPTVEMLSSDSYEHRVYPGGVIVADSAYDVTGKGDYESKWINVYQHLSNKTINNETGIKAGVSLAAKGLATAYFREGTNDRAPQVVFNLYRESDAIAKKGVQSIAELGSLVEQGLRDPERGLPSKRFVTVRVISQEEGESLFLGNISRKSVKNESGVYVQQSSAEAAKEFVEAVSSDNRNRRMFKLIDDHMKNGNKFDIEVIPGSTINMGRGSLTSLNWFDENDKLIVNPADSDKKTYGQAMRDAFRTINDDGQFDYLAVPVQLSIGFYKDTNEPLVSAMSLPSYSPNGYMISDIPTSNFSRTPEKTIERKAPVNEDQVNDQRKVAEKQENEDVDAQLDSISMDEIDAALDDLDIPMPHN